MQIDTSDRGRYREVRLSGEVDLHNSRDVKAVLLKEVEQQAHVVVEFSELTYIDSSGMATLVEAFNLAKSKGLEFHIAGAKEAPLQVLKLTRLDSVFSLVESVDHLQE